MAVGAGRSAGRRHAVPVWESEVGCENANDVCVRVVQLPFNLTGDGTTVRVLAVVSSAAVRGLSMIAATAAVAVAYGVAWTQRA